MTIFLKNSREKPTLYDGNRRLMLETMIVFQKNGCGMFFKKTLDNGFFFKLSFNVGNHDYFPKKYGHGMFFVEKKKKKIIN